MFFIAAIVVRVFMILEKDTINDWFDIYAPRWQWLQCMPCRWYNLAFIEFCLWVGFAIEIGLLNIL